MTIAVFLAETKGNLLFYNEAAEEMLGIRFAETGSRSVLDWPSTFTPTDLNGNLLSHESNRLGMSWFIAFSGGPKKIIMAVIRLVFR